MRAASVGLLCGLLALVALGFGLSLQSVADRPVGRLPAAESTPLKLPTHPADWRGEIDYRALDARIDLMMTDPSMQGLAVAVVEGGRLSFVKAYGVESAESGHPVGVETVFRWASLSKTLSGALSAQLAGLGVLSLSDRLGSFDTSLRLPGDAQQDLTLAELLSHRTGLPKNAFDGRLEDGEDPRAIRRSFADAPSVCLPATCHSYQNIAFDTIAEVIAARTGETFGETARRRLFHPLGMSSATLGVAGLTSAERWARPHHNQVQLAVSEAYYRVPAAAGVNSNIIDLAVWMQALMGLRADVLPQSVLETSQQVRVATASPYGRSAMGRSLSEAGYGLGVRSFSYKGHRLVGHSGGVSGYRATMLFDPATRTGVAMLWNSDANLPFYFQAEVMDRAYGDPFVDWLNVKPKPGQATRTAPIAAVP